FVAQTIAYAHSLDIYHGNLLPENIIFGRENTKIVVTDFIISSFLAAHNPNHQSNQNRSGFRAPEWDGNKPTAAGDIFSLGALLYYLISGQVPPKGLVAKPGAALPQIPELRALVPSLPTWLETLTARCMMADPLERPSSAEDIAEEIETGLKTNEEELPPDTASVADKTHTVSAAPATAPQPPSGNSSLLRNETAGINVFTRQRNLPTQPSASVQDAEKRFQEMSLETNSQDNTLDSKSGISISTPAEAAEKPLQTIPPAANGQVSAQDSKQHIPTPAKAAEKPLQIMPPAANGQVSAQNRKPIIPVPAPIGSISQNAVRPNVNESNVPPRNQAPITPNYIQAPVGAIRLPVSQPTQQRPRTVPKQVSYNDNTIKIFANQPEPKSSGLQSIQPNSFQPVQVKANVSEADPPKAPEATPAPIEAQQPPPKPAKRGKIPGLPPSSSDSDATVKVFLDKDGKPTDQQPQDNTEPKKRRSCGWVIFLFISLLAGGLSLILTHGWAILPNRQTNGTLHINAVGADLQGTVLLVKVFANETEIALTSLENGKGQITVPLGKKITVKAVDSQYEANATSTTLTPEDSDKSIRLDVKPVTQMTISGPPYADVYIDGVKIGSCDSQGSFVLNRKYLSQGSKLSIKANPKANAPAKGKAKS
ncbi:protein kinase, partial [bacterium]|nr:protein kinase [bacterium]